MATGKSRSPRADPGDTATADELEAAAAAAAAAAGDLEARALDGERGIDLDDIRQLARESEGLTFRARIARRREQQAAESARLAGLAELRADVERFALAADAEQDMNAALELISDAAAAFRAAADAHGAALAAFLIRATELQAGPPAPGGPSTAHGRVARSAMRILAGDVQVIPLRDTDADAMLTAALSGDIARVPADALVITTPRQRPGVVLYSPHARNFIERDSADFEGYQYQRDRGELVPLTEQEITAYLDGQDLDMAEIGRRCLAQQADAAAVVKASRMRAATGREG